jgi:cobalt-zinc-cadmium efflux system protein
MPDRHPSHDHDHDHAHSHGHAHAPVHFGRAFAIGIALNLAYLVVEAGFGVAANSLALISDAAHNLGDVLALGAAWGAATLAARRPSGRYTYGLRRTSIFAAVGNAVALLIVTGGVAWQAIMRLIAPEPTHGVIVIVVAAAGIVVNGSTALLFLRGRKDDLNIRAAFQHMAADAAIALGVAAAGGAILATGWQWLDPAAGLIVGAVIVAGTWSLLREAVNLSLDAVPEGIDRTAVKAYLDALPGIVEVHDLHIWGLSTTETALTAHLIYADGTRHDALLPEICTAVRERFGIGHATIQLETPELARQCALRPDHVV